MPTFSNIGGAEPSTVTFKLASVTQDRGGVTEHQEIVTLGGTESTLAVAAVLAANPASTAWGLAVRVADPSTGPFAVSSIAGPVTVRSSAANALVSVYQSTAADLNVTVAGYVAPSTTVNVSSLAGAVITRSSKADMLVTAYQSSAADFNVTVAGYSTTVNISSLAGPVITRSSKADMLVSVYQSTAADLNVTVAGYSTVVNVSTIQGVVRIAGNNAADGIVHVGDSTNAALRVNVVAGAAGGSTIVTVSALPLISSAVAAGNSSALTVRNVWSSTNTDQPVSAAQAGTWNIGTITSLSSLSTGHVTVDTGVIRAQAYTSSGGAVEGSTTAPAGGVIGLHVREALQDLLSTRAVITSSNSTALYTLVSSAAGLKHKVYAYSLTSTETNPSTIVFMSSNAIDRWAVSFGSGSSGIAGANLSVSPPAYIFKTDAANALRCLIEKGASTQCIATLSIAYFSEP